MASPMMDEMKTSTQIAFPYRPAMTLTYDKKPLPKLPILRTRGFKVGSYYSPFERFKSTYNETFNRTLITDDNPGLTSMKLTRRPKEYSKVGKIVRPLNVGTTEYGDEYQAKEFPPNVQGTSVERETTCPMILTGRDEREALPLNQNYSKYLDIYVSTSRMAYRQFTLDEQLGLASKDIVTYHETMGTTKGRGFGCKHPPHLFEYLDKRDKKMTDKVKFKTEHNLRFVPNPMPKVPNFGSESETQSAYKRPTGLALPRIFDRFVEFPATICTPTARQALCPPGMYTTETSAINKHTSPQTVV